MCRSLRLMIALGVAGAIPAIAFAGPLQDGAAAYERQDYAQAMQLLRPLAERGDALAQVIVGGMYAKGYGVPQNGAEAARWFGLSAAQGNEEGEAALGVVYQAGTGVAVDYSQALHWFGLAATQGDQSAQYGLGLMYENGEGTAKDTAEALRWYRLSAAQGDDAAAKAVKRLTQGGLAQILQEDAHSCTDPQSSSDLRIQGCTALIDSGQVSGQSLAGVFNNRAAAYYSESDNAHAIADFTQAIELNPSLAGAHYNRGDAYLANKEYERAIADYDAAIRANPQDAWAYHDRGLAERHLGRTAQSEVDMTKARSIDPSVGK